jgi:hypothetical protein
MVMSMLPLLFISILRAWIGDSLECIYGITGAEFYV